MDSISRVHDQGAQTGLLSALKKVTSVSVSLVLGKLYCPGSTSKNMINLTHFSDKFILIHAPFQSTKKYSMDEKMDLLNGNSGLLLKVPDGTNYLISFFCIQFTHNKLLPHRIKIGFDLYKVSSTVWK